MISGAPKDVFRASVFKETGAKEMEDLLSKYNHLFEGIGKIEDKRGNSEFLGRFHINPGIVPVAQEPRQVPYYLQEPLQKRLDQGIEEDIFEKVPADEPITWCSPATHADCRHAHLQTVDLQTCRPADLQTADCRLADLQTCRPGVRTRSFASLLGSISSRLLKTATGYKMGLENLRDSYFTSLFAAPYLGLMNNCAFVVGLVWRIFIW